MLPASIPDLLRLLAIPVFAWAAWRDVETRRVPNETWYPLAALALLALGWEAWAAWTATSEFVFRAFAVRTAVSVGFVVPLSYAFWRLGGFGGADAKAFMVVAVLLPTFPTYALAGWTLPVQQTALGVFSLTVLTNTVLVGALYPVALVARNALAGRFSRAMVVGVPVRWDDLSRTHGRLLETPDGLTRSGVDLDAVRMYLRWRGLTLAELRDGRTELRDPATLPSTPNPPGDGMVTDGGVATDDSAAPATEMDDPWGVRAFLDDIDHGAYGTSPDQLREGLDVLTSEEVVWVSPGIPFIVPLLVGLVVAFGYGDLLFGLLGALGLA